MQGIQAAVLGNMGVALPILIAVVLILVIYLALMAKAIIDMLRYDVPGALLAFAFLALIPVPLFLIMGIMVLIIWHHHKKDILVGNTQTRQSH